MRKYAEAFHLNVLGSSTVEASSFSKATGTWTLKLRTPSGSKIVKAKHVVQSTGTTGSKAYIPDLPGRNLYKGVSIHSAQYMNPKTLKGAKVSMSYQAIIQQRPMTDR